MQVLITIAVFVIFVIATSPLIAPYLPEDKNWTDYINLVSGFGSFLAALWVIRTSDETTKLSQETYETAKLASNLLREAKEKAELLVVHDYKPRFNLTFNPTITFEDSKIKEVTCYIELQNAGIKLLDIQGVGILVSTNREENKQQTLLLHKSIHLTPGFIWNRTFPLQVNFPERQVSIVIFIDYFDPSKQVSERYTHSPFDINPTESTFGFRAV
jgi:hypothetical protein